MKSNCKYCKREIPDDSIYCPYCGERLARTKREKKKEISVPKPRQLPSGLWFAQMMVDGERVPISGDTEKEYYVKARAAKAGLIEAHKPDNRIVQDLVKEYIDSREKDPAVSPSTIDGYLRKSKHNLQDLMKLRIKDLSRAAVQRAIDKDKQKYAGKTIWEAWSLIQSATGVRYDDLDFPSRKPRRKPPVYRKEDIRKLIVAFADYGGQVECAGLLAMWLSLRRSEIVGLRWENVLEDSIRIKTARVYDKSHKLIEKDTKTELSERTIPCDDYILQKINALPHDSEYVFTMSTAGIWKGVDTVCRRAGVEHGYLHGFRHTNASVMEYLGVPPKYANERGGWASDHVRQRTYTDAMDEGKVEYAEKINEFFNGLIANGITNENQNPQ
nr:tyrosine-type recombinase/integrase [Clostridia bacterium]